MHWKLSAGGNDWENGATWAWVDFSDHRGDSERLWIQIAENGHKSDSDCSEKEQKEYRDYGESVWKTWLECAKDFVRKKEKEYGRDGTRHAGSYTWQDGFREAAKSDKMKPMVSASGEMTSEFREKEAAAFTPRTQEDYPFMTESEVVDFNQIAAELGEEEAERWFTEEAVKRKDRQEPFGVKDWLKSFTQANLDPRDPNNVATALDLGLMAGDMIVSAKTSLTAARKATRQPVSYAQAEAGNYRKGTYWWNGLEIKIENPKGSTRKGLNEDGSVAWTSKMYCDYGYVKGSRGVDGDAVDVFMGPNFASDVVYVIDQVDQKTGEFDEHKCVLGCDSKEQAKELYLKNYEDGWKVGPVQALTFDQFKFWVRDGEKEGPLSEEEHVKLAFSLLGAPIGAGIAAVNTGLRRRKISDKEEENKEEEKEELPSWKKNLMTGAAIGSGVGTLTSVGTAMGLHMHPRTRGGRFDIVDMIRERLGLEKSGSTEGFDPDLNEDDMQEAYDAIYGKSKPQLAGMSQWPNKWMPAGSDSLGWINWYKGYLNGTRTDDDQRQIDRHFGSIFTAVGLVANVDESGLDCSHNRPVDTFVCIECYTVRFLIGVVDHVAGCTVFPSSHNKMQPVFANVDSLGELRTARRHDVAFIT